MQGLIDPVEAQRLVNYTISGFAIMMMCSVIYTFMVMRYIRGRVITFMLVTWSLFLTFFVTFYGLDYLMRSYWELEPTLGDPGIRIVSLGMASGLMALLALFCKFAIQEGPSLMESEQANLKDEEMTPMDFNRREYMDKKQRRKS